MQLRSTLLLCCVLSAAHAQTAPPHLTQAESLITALLSNPNNVNIYGTPAHIDWSGDPRTAVSECSSFVSLLLKHTYGYSDTAFKTKTGSTSPNAALYHDDIVAGKAFTSLSNPAALLPGDILAVKYPAGGDSSGHAMVVESIGAWQSRYNSTQAFLTTAPHPEIAGYYDVTVIDSSASFHGPTDSRASKPGGIGRGGIARLYVDINNQLTGYTWSTVNGSSYQTPAAGYLMAFGRWIP